MDQLQWGVIGTIEKARNFAADLPYASENHTLHSILTDEEANVDDTQPSVQHIYSDIEEFLQSDIDAVYVASPHKMHYAHVKQCLLHHIPVLCERPIAQDARELKHLMELAEAHDTFMMEAMWIRFLPNIKKVLGIVSSGAIGDIISIKASVNYKNTDVTKITSDDDEGVLIELGTYPIFLCVLFLGCPDFVEATGKKTANSENDFFSAFLSYSEGQYAFIEASTINKGGSHVTIEGNKGLIQIKNPWSSKPEGIEVDFYNGTKVLHKAEWEGRGFQFEADEVYKCLNEDLIESQLYPHHFTLDVMQTMDNIRQKIK